MKSFTELFMSVVERLADKPGLVYDGQTLTFAQLKDAAVKQAEVPYSGFGIVPIIEASPLDAVIKQIGYFLRGIPCTIVNSNYPKERIDYIVNECNSAVPPDTAYTVFTSGSTGKPKGVLLSKKNLETLFNVHIGFFHENDTWLSLFPVHFVVELMLPVKLLLNGITAHPATDAVRKDVNAVCRYIQEKGITAVGVPPTLCNAVLRSTEDTLKILFTGSELVRNVYSSKTQVYIGYGCSETAGMVTSFAVDKAYSSTPVGKAIAGVKVYLLDDGGNLAAPGPNGEVQGEICVAQQAAGGYLNQKELTAERFVKNPFEKQDGCPALFHTRDIGQFLPDGNLQYIQRKDWMVKINGNLVEPGEIEVAALRFPNIDKAVAKDFKNANGETRLYLCYTASQKVEPEELRLHLERFLPDYMVPAFIEQKDSLPINQNGKIDRISIAPPDTAQYQAPYIAPANEHERLLCRAFADVLGLPQVGINDDFVRLGGDSVSAVQVQIQLPKTMSVSAAVLNRLRTPKALAEYFASEKNSTETDAVIPHIVHQDEWAVSVDEEWFLKRYVNQPSLSTHILFAISLSGNLDVNRLGKAVRTLFERHRVLRSVYHQTADGHFTRTLGAVPPIPLQHVVLHTQNNEKITAAVLEKNVFFDLAGGQLCRFFLFETAPETHILCLNAFHSVCDGGSLPVILNGLAALYQQNSADTLSGETDVPDFLDFTEWRQTSSRSAADREFYTQMFSDGFLSTGTPSRQHRLPPLRCNAPATPQPADGGSKVHFDYGGLEKPARQLGVSLFSLFVSAAGLALGQCCRSNEAVMSIVTNVRTAFPVLQNAVGMLADRFPIRLRWQKDQTLTDFIRHTDNLLSGIQQHQGYSGRKWMQDAAPDIDMDVTPTMNINYRQLPVLPVFQDLQTQAFPIPIILFADSPKISGILVFINRQRNTAFDTSLMYPTELFERTTIEGMHACFADILRHITDKKDVSLGNLFD
ncbi:MAG: AMP-binding protein [Planctomycetaceae bacterium]|jgi:acyl-CoA synthetase (AMP-forming)/AMP-acid ligase II|nr:AMP-binding protein [Planctomycetaceae bacterium]